MNRITNILLPIFAVGWLLFIALDYWQKHPVYFFAFQKFQYWGLSIFLLLLGGGAGWVVLKFGKKKKPPRWQCGLSVFGLFLLVSVASVGMAYGQLTDVEGFSLPKAARVLGLVGGTALAVYGLTLVAHTAGNLLTSALGLQVRPSDAPVIDLATGLAAVSLLLFGLGAVGVLHWLAVLPVFAVLLFFGRKNALGYLRRTLWQPFAFGKKFNWLGAGSAYLLLVVTALNFTAVNVPMPAGFDALTYYANLPALIGQHGGLVEGYQPYNWSLLMSLGHVVFGSTAVSLAISWLGGLLSLVALYVLCRSWLQLEQGNTFLLLLVFSLTPAFYIQSSAELKIDLGLLFVYLSILLLFLHYVRAFSKGKKTAEPPRWYGSPVLLLMGLLTGFALGVKLTTIYFTLALVAALWYLRASWRGLLGVFLISLFLVFAAQLDAVTGLRQYHLGVGRLQWGVLLAGVLLLAGAFFENKKNVLDSLRSTAVYGAFLVLPFLPWMVKNYVETQRLDPQTLLNGKAATPPVDLSSLLQNAPN